MAQINWTGNGNGHTANVSAGLSLTLSGSTVPSNATITSVTCRYGYSQSKWGSNYSWVAKWMANSNLSKFFYGAQDNTNRFSETMTGSNSGDVLSQEAPTGHGVTATLSSNLTEFKGKSSYTFKFRGGSTSPSSYGSALLRYTVLHINYYVACGNPSGITASGGQKKITLTSFTAATNGTSDSVSSYEICYASSKSWNSNTAVARTTSQTSTAYTWSNITTAGTYYIGVRVKGSSSGWHSPVWSSALTVTVNTAPAKPTIQYPPAAGKTTYNTKPYFRMTGTDADGNTLKYQYKIDSGSWADVASSVTSGTAKDWQCSTALTAGSHTLYVRTYDGTAYSEELSRTFTVATPTAVTETTITDENTIDLYQTYITNQRAWYNLSAYSYTTVNTPATLNRAVILELETAIEATPHVATSYMTTPSAGAVCKISDTFTILRNALLSA